MLVDVDLTPKSTTGFGGVIILVQAAKNITVINSNFFILKIVISC